jgi:hypothetical protein
MILIRNKLSGVSNNDLILINNINEHFEKNYKHTVLRFRQNIGDDVSLNKTSDNNITYVKNGVLLDVKRNLLLAIEYKNSMENTSLFFKKSNRIIRLYFPFVDKASALDYSSLYSSFKTYILKQYSEEGVLFEIVNTQIEMKQGITSILDIPNFSNLEEYKSFTDDFLNETKYDI